MIENITKNHDQLIDKKQLEQLAEIQARKDYAGLAVKANAENKVIYTRENGEYELVDPITYQTCIFNGKNWVEDTDKKVIYEQGIMNKNKSILSYLLLEANEKITILQDIIDLEMQENNKDEQLKSWKKYRILLARIDTNQLEINLPEKPH